MIEHFKIKRYVSSCYLKPLKKPRMFITKKTMKHFLFLRKTKLPPHVMICESKLWGFAFSSILRSGQLFNTFMCYIHFNKNHSYFEYFKIVINMRDVNKKLRLLVLFRVQKTRYIQTVS